MLGHDIQIQMQNMQVRPHMQPLRNKERDEEKGRATASETHKERDEDIDEARKANNESVRQARGKAVG